MSSPLAIAGVTAVLKDLLNEGLINHDLSKVGSFSVTALPPDRITIGATEPNQLNLYLYLVTPNQGWRNVALPSRNGKGDRLTNQPLALNLHYMLTAYGSEDFNAEILLGYAMHVLHENPVPTRQQIRRSLGGPSPVSGGILPPSPSPFGSVMADDLADQAELLKVTPQSLSSDEMSKLWTAFQSKYRPSSAYMVSVVLIQATGPTVTALPVLKRGDKDRGVKAITGALPSRIGTVRSQQAGGRARESHHNPGPFIGGRHRATRLPKSKSRRPDSGCHSGADKRARMYGESSRGEPSERWRHRGRDLACGVL